MCEYVCVVVEDDDGSDVTGGGPSSSRTAEDVSRAQEGVGGGAEGDCERGFHHHSEKSPVTTLENRTRTTGTCYPNGRDPRLKE